MENISDPYEDRWSDTPVNQLMDERPFLGIKILSVYNLISAIIGLIVFVFVFTQTSFPSQLGYYLFFADESVSVLAGIALIFLIAGIILTISQFFTAYGLLKGFTWAWWLQFVITIFMGISGLLGSYVQFFIAIIILVYITRPNVKAVFNVK